MGRFETAWLTSDVNLVALADLSGAWIDRVHARKPQTAIVLDMDSSVSEPHGAQEGAAYSGHTHRGSRDLRRGRVAGPHVRSVP